MGRFYSYGPMTDGHEGYTERLDPDGRWRSGYQSENPQLAEPAGLWEQTWRAACDCEWRGEAVVVIRRADVDPYWLSDDDDDDEHELVMRRWERHMAPLVAVGKVWEADDAARDAADELRQAVKDARTAGASWSDLGRALGVTKQAAQQRFSD